MPIIALLLWSYLESCLVHSNSERNLMRLCIRVARSTIMTSSHGS